MSDQQCSKLNIGEGCGNHVAFGELSHAIKSWAEECQNHMSHKLNLENPQKRNIVKVKTGTIFARYRSKQTSYCAKKKSLVNTTSKKEETNTAATIVHIQYQR
uniref:(northern house mosquito) hypothetical protein n=1 Tax=Culex pipiens TaxID=7175 RepID=A0A8D8AYQ8_CULPI